MRRHTTKKSDAVESRRLKVKSLKCLDKRIFSFMNCVINSSSRVLTSFLIMRNGAKGRETDSLSNIVIWKTKIYHDRNNRFKKERW